jgi:hypothetical protein
MSTVTVTTIRGHVRRHAGRDALQFQGYDQHGRRAQGNRFQRGTIRGWGNETRFVIINLLQFEPREQQRRWISEVGPALSRRYASASGALRVGQREVDPVVKDAHNYELITVFVVGDLALFVTSPLTAAPDRSDSGCGAAEGTGDSAAGSRSAT